MYVDKYRCTECGRSYHSIARPMECSSCGGTVCWVEAGQYPVDHDTALNYMEEKDVQAAIDEFERGFDDWRDSLG